MVSDTVPPFRVLSDAELQELPDDELIAYVRRARTAGETAAARRALHILVAGAWDQVRARLRMRLGRVDAATLDDLTADALLRAITSSFDGSSVGQFRAWLNTIVERTAIDHHRRRERVPQPTPLTADGGDDEPALRHPRLVEPDPTGFVDARTIVDRCLEELSDPHRRVVELVVFRAFPAAEAAAQVPGMTPANVHQIASRFRRRLRTLLEEDNP
jgi:RNA polymerase sigma factor (sigma-70 family)